MDHNPFFSHIVSANSSVLQNPTVVHILMHEGIIMSKGVVSVSHRRLLISTNVVKKRGHI